jgi:lysophospholipase L1-like esterase
VGGDTAAMLDARMETTVLNHNPTVVVIFIGINDVRRAAYNEDGSRNLSNYMNTIQDIVQKCKKCPTVRSIVLMTPMAIGDKYDGESQWDSTIDTMAQDLRDYAASNALGLIDVRRVVIDAEKKFNTEDKSFGVLMDNTLVHPTSLGGQILAGTALMGFGQ